MVTVFKSRPRIRDLGYNPGQLKPGPKNSILDVDGVGVGQVTIHEGEDVHTGVTVILPRPVDKIGLLPCYAATHDLNGEGEMTGVHALTEWGYTASPIAFTNTISVGKVYDAIFRWQLARMGDDVEKSVRRYNIPVVGETFDGLLNNIGLSVIEQSHVEAAIKAASVQTEVFEGNYGGGTAMRCHGFKGGSGTSSRIVPGFDSNGNPKDYTLGVLVQSNYGGILDLHIGGVPIGRVIMKERAAKAAAKAAAGGETPTPDPLEPRGGKLYEGSCLVLAITDAPLLPHQLRRVAQHCGMGIATIAGQGAGRNFSGEIFLALSTGTSPNLLAERSDGAQYLPPVETQTVETVRNETIEALNYAVAEATEEAILNSLCKAETLTGWKGSVAEAMPVERVRQLLQRYYVDVEKHEA